MPQLSYWTLLIIFLAADPAAARPAGQERAVVRLGDFSLSLAQVGDRVWLFELSPREVTDDQPLELSPMIDPAVRERLTIPTSPDGQLWTGPGITVGITRDPPQLTVSRTDGKRLFTLAPYTPDGQLAGLTFSGPFTHLLGLGADFRLQSEVLNLLGQVSLPAGPFGNARLGGRFSRPNQVQIPILYGLGDGLTCGALFVDETLPLQWDLKNTPWTVTPAGPLAPRGTLRFFILTGPTLAALRAEFMNLVGRPPTPPRKMLGAWISGLQEIKTGGVSAEELADDRQPSAEPLASRSAPLPGLKEKLVWLREQTPGLAGLLAGPETDAPALRAALQAENLELMLDESARIPRQSPHYQEMARRSFLVKDGGPQGQPLTLNYAGRASGLVDYTNPAAAAFWHSLERKNLTDEGQAYFRLLDGDLEDAGPEAWYAGPAEGGAHSHYVWSNAYALKWLEGLETRITGWGFPPPPRPWLLVSSGAAGLARHSGGLYNSEAFIFTGGFAGQSIFGVQSHLALAGVDYYSTDPTSALKTWPVERFFPNYDAWLAKNALTSYPLILPEALATRPAGQHNLALRESLSPYIYSLTWLAWREGRPVLAPLVYYFQEDLQARDRLPEIMLGPHLLVSLNLDPSAERTKVYVPRGRWYNWRTGEVLDQESGGEINLDTKVNGQFSPPILARGGAIIPAVEYLNPREGVTEKIAALKIFIGRESSEFNWYEDDGHSQAYRRRDQPAFGRTGISAVTQTDGSTLVTIMAREGGWSEAPAERPLLVDIYGPQAPGQATLDNLPHNRVAQVSALDRLDSGWASFGDNRIRFKTPPLDLSVNHVLWFK